MFLFSLLFATILFACSIEEIGNGKSSGSFYSSFYSSPRSSSSRTIAPQEPLSYQGQSYKTVKMGSQIWIVENLNVETSSGSWCHGTLPERCRIYGKLYDWAAAKVVCPDGWVLPSADDYDNLLDFGDVLNSSVGWNATLGGLKYEDERGFAFLDKEGYWWTSTEAGNRANYHNIKEFGNKLDKYDAEKTRGFSVRCIKK